MVIVMLKGLKRTQFPPEAALASPEHNRLSMDHLPSMNRREWSVKSCPLRTSASLAAYICLQIALMSCVKAPLSLFCISFPPLFPELVSDLSGPCHRYNRSGEESKPEDQGPVLGGNAASCTSPPNLKGSLDWWFLEKIRIVL